MICHSNKFYRFLILKNCYKQKQKFLDSETVSKYKSMHSCSKSNITKFSPPIFPRRIKATVLFMSNSSFPHTKASQKRVCCTKQHNPLINTCLFFTSTLTSLINCICKALKQSLLLACKKGACCLEYKSEIYFYAFLQHKIVL